MGEDVVRRQAIDRWIIAGCRLAEATELREIGDGDGDYQEAGCMLVSMDGCW
jgi:hypothetical protein